MVTVYFWVIKDRWPNSMYGIIDMYDVYVYIWYIYMYIWCVYIYIYCVYIYIYIHCVCVYIYIYIYISIYLSESITTYIEKFEGYTLKKILWVTGLGVCFIPFYILLSKISLLNIYHFYSHFCLPKERMRKNLKLKVGDHLGKAYKSESVTGKSRY